MTDDSNEPIIRVENLVKLFPISGTKKFVQAVKDVSFEVKPGETIGLIGESGSGKTTIGRCVAKLESITEGKIYFHGKDIDSMTKAEYKDFRRRVQVVFQQPYESLNPNYNSYQTIAEPLILNSDRKLTSKEIMDRVLELMEQVHLETRHLYSYPFELSAGAQQRLSIARAIATNPDIIILDEATSMLDLSTRAEIIDLLIDLQKRLHVAYIFISHDLTTVEYICQTVAVMYLSQIVEFGSVSQVFGHPIHPYSRALLSAALPPNPSIKSGKYLLEGEIPSPVDLPTGCYLSSRCPEVCEQCMKTAQVLYDMGDGHQVRCQIASQKAVLAN